MSSSTVVSNSSPLIALKQISHLNLLEMLFSTILIPPAVIQEISPTVDLPPWIVRSNLKQSMGPKILSASLGPGESEAISLALEVDAKWIILDDRPARRLAQTLGLSVLGTRIQAARFFARYPTTS